MNSVLWRIFPYELFISLDWLLGLSLQQGIKHDILSAPLVCMVGLKQTFKAHENGTNIWGKVHYDKD